MNTMQIRAAMKMIDRAARVSGRDGRWTVRFESASHLDAVRAKAIELGLTIVGTDIEGGRFDWSYAVTVAS